MSRKRRGPRERERLFNHHGRRCYLCKMPIQQGDAWELEHLIPWELTRDESDTNVRPAHKVCHKPKTADDIRGIRKADRQRQKHFGIKHTSRPMPGSRASGWRKPMHGPAERRTP